MISKPTVPREVELVKELPKTSTGKVKKNVLRRGGREITARIKNQGSVFVVLYLSIV